MKLRPHDEAPAPEGFNYVLQHKTFPPSYRKKVVFYATSYVSHTLLIGGNRRPTIYVKTAAERNALCLVRGGWEDVTEQFIEDYVTEVAVEDALVGAATPDAKTEARREAKAREVHDNIAGLVERTPDPPKRGTK